MQGAQANIYRPETTYNPKDRYHVRNSRTLDLVLSHPDSFCPHFTYQPVHTQVSFRTFQAKLCIPARWPTHLVLLDLAVLIALTETYIFQCSSPCNFPQLPDTSSCYGPNALLITMFSDTCSSIDEEQFQFCKYQFFLFLYNPQIRLLKEWNENGCLFSLIYSCCWTLLEKPPIAQLFKNFPAFYGIRTFITAFTKSLH
jgi:hypothetical protein